MAEGFQCKIILPEELVFSGSIEALIAPGAKGEMTVLSKHEPSLVMLAPGIVTLKLSEAKEKRFLIFSGFLDIRFEFVSLLLEQIIEIGKPNTNHQIKEKKQKAYEDLQSEDDALRLHAQACIDSILSLEKTIIS